MIKNKDIKKHLELCGPNTKIYIGCDSERFKINGEWFADYILVVVIHNDGNKGCKVFSEVHREKDYDAKQNKPFQRMMMETYKVSELYLKLSEFLMDNELDYEIEVHLDINPKESAGSNCAYQAAMGYIKGVCGVDPRGKPDAFAASYCADRVKGIYNLSPLSRTTHKETE